jgi:hypothetical protein
VWYAADAATLAVFGWILAAARHRSAPLLEYALVTTVMLIVSPFSLRIYFATLFLPCAVLATVIARSPADLHRRAFVSVLIAVAAAGTMLPLIPGRHWSLLFEALSPHFFVAVAVASCLAMLRLR